MKDKFTLKKVGILFKPVALVGAAVYLSKRAFKIGQEEAIEAAKRRSLEVTANES